MPKEIIVVYQDCVLCGDRGEKRRQYLAKKGLGIRKVSAFSDEGQQLVNKAVLEHKMGSLPFYTDGEKFSYHATTFLKTEESPEEPDQTPKITKKSPKKKSVKGKTNNESDKKN